MIFLAFLLSAILFGTPTFFKEFETIFLFSNVQNKVRIQSIVTKIRVFFRWFLHFFARFFIGKSGFGVLSFFIKSLCLLGFCWFLSKLTKNNSKSTFLTIFWYFWKFTSNTTISILFKKHKIHLDWILTRQFGRVGLWVLLNSEEILSLETIHKNTIENHTHFHDLCQQWGIGQWLYLVCAVTCKNTSTLHVIEFKKKFSYSNRRVFHLLPKMSQIMLLFGNLPCSATVK